MKEIWKPVKDFEGMYEVSNTGKVKSIKRSITTSSGRILPIPERILSGSKDTKGYLQVEFKKNGKRHIYFTHRLVAEAFLELKEGKNQVNHKDGNKLNNSVENLEWVTCQENIIHAWKNNLNKPFLGEKHPNHKLTEDEVRFIKTNYKPRDREFGANALARRFGVSVSPICEIVNNKRWTHIK